MIQNGDEITLNKNKKYKYLRKTIFLEKFLFFQNLNPLSNKNNLVYKINCEGTYIGQISIPV